MEITQSSSLSNTTNKPTIDNDAQDDNDAQECNEIQPEKGNGS